MDFPSPLKNSGIFLPPKRKRIIKAMIRISVEPKLRNIIYLVTSLTSSASFLTFLNSLVDSPKFRDISFDFLLPKKRKRTMAIRIISGRPILFKKLNISYYNYLSKITLFTSLCKMEITTPIKIAHQKLMMPIPLKGANLATTQMAATLTIKK